MKASECFPSQKQPSFDERLAIGKRFEEKASHFLTSVGFPIGLNFSAQGQWEFGESAAHCDIEKNQHFPHTGNLFNETKKREVEDGFVLKRQAHIKLPGKRTSDTALVGDEFRAEASQ